MNKGKRSKIRKKTLKKLSSKETALLAGTIANEKKADNIIILNTSKTSSISDYVIICSGSSDRQVRAITDAIIEALQKAGQKPLDIEGYNEGKWTLIDFVDVVIHVFYEPMRYYYRLEELWSESERITVQEH